MHMNPVQAIRGMNDILPEDTGIWLHVESVFRSVVEACHYRQIRTPILEHTELFARSIGAETDIVAKEMYTFDDRNGDSLTLRPEGTASCARAGIQNGLFHNQQQRIWYAGPMFRHERPQRGRFRQFHQLGAEAYGWGGPDIDVEIIALTARFWRKLGLSSPRLQINSLGSEQARRAYQSELVGFLEGHVDRLDDDSTRRLKTNPLRILDSKNPDIQNLLADAPSILDCLDIESREEFEFLRQGLEALEIEFEVNPRLVRGLDYYSKMVFEWVVEGLGAQSTVCAGGRYDGLVADIGGKPTPAVGFAAGIERIVDLVSMDGAGIESVVPDIFLVSEGEGARVSALRMAEELRDSGLIVQTHCGGGGIKNQFRKADQSGAALALVIAESELDAGVVTIKKLRDGGQQLEASAKSAVKTVQELLNSL